MIKYSKPYKDGYITDEAMNYASSFMNQQVMSLINSYTHGAMTGSDREAAEFNAEEAQKNRDFQMYMSNTQYQRGVRDMQMAGVNPALVYGQGGQPAPVTSGDSGSASANGQFDLSSLLAQILQVKKLGIESDLAKSEVAKNEAIKNNNEADSAQKTENTRLIRLRADYQEKYNKYADDILTNTVNQGKINIRVATANAELIEADTQLRPYMQKELEASIAEKYASEKEKIANAAWLSMQTALAEIEKDIKESTKKWTIDMVEMEYLSELWNKEFREKSGFNLDDGTLAQLFMQMAGGVARIFSPGNFNDPVNIWHLPEKSLRALAEVASKTFGIPVETLIKNYQEAREKALSGEDGTITVDTGERNPTFPALDNGVITIKTGPY